MSLRLFSSAKLFLRKPIHCRGKKQYSFLQYRYLSEGKLKSDAENPDDEYQSNSNANLTTVRLQILDSSLNYVPVYGWSKKSLALGAESIGLSSSSHTLIQGGIAELVHYFNFSCNSKLQEILKEFQNADKKIDLQSYIEKALEERLKMNIPYLSMWPKGLSLVSTPIEAATDMKNTLDLVDIIWREAGDQSVGASWYSKRISLAAIYRTCELSLLQDSSPDYSDTYDLLHRQVESYMKCMQSLDHIPVFGSLAATMVRSFLGANQWFRR